VLLLSLPRHCDEYLLILSPRRCRKVVFSAREVGSAVLPPAFFSTICQPPTPTLFPYTTLFRSGSASPTWRPSCSARLARSCSRAGSRAGAETDIIARGALSLSTGTRMERARRLLKTSQQIISHFLCS